MIGKRKGIRGAEAVIAILAFALSQQAYGQEVPDTNAINSQENSVIHEENRNQVSDTTKLQTIVNRETKPRRYWKVVNPRFNGFYCTETQAANAEDLLAIQNANNIELTRKPFTGYGFGVGIFVRPAKNFDFFFDINYFQIKTFIAHEGDKLVGGIAQEWSYQGFGDEAPTAPHDLYYGSKTYFAKLGGRFIFPVSRSFEPWVGFGYGLITYETAMGNKDLLRAYTDIVTGTTTLFTLLAGVDFNLFTSPSDNTKLLGLSLFTELGRSVPPTDYEDFLYQGFKYHISQTPILPYFRFGIALH